MKNPRRPQPSKVEPLFEKYKEYTELETLTSDIANDVVKRVTVYKDGGIEIELALRDE